MLAFPLNTIHGMPWAHQAVMTPVAVTLNALAGLSTNGTLELGITCAAVAWVVGLVLLAALCFRFYYKDKDAGSMAVKVRVQTAVYAERMGVGQKGAPA
jgi:hypothetical protein